MQLSDAIVIDLANAQSAIQMYTIHAIRNNDG